ncbi:MAG: YqzE family protein [Gorillibacterium sp.]|nr:YqzE family protein [Gorillibacterium sp.]
MASKRDEILQQLTAKVVTYIDTPKEQRKQNRIAEKLYREHWSSRWFGLLPASLRILFTNRKK